MIVSDDDRGRTARVTPRQISQWVDFANPTFEAAGFPDALVVFFRYGPGDRPTGGGFSWIDYDLVIMPGFTDAQHFGHAHVDALAQEIGHHLGLPHTFAADPFESAAAGETHLKAGGGTPDVFDGDGFGDTPPDASIRALACDPIEAESLQVLAEDGARTAVQRMSGFEVGDWSDASLGFRFGIDSIELLR